MQGRSCGLRPFAGGGGWYDAGLRRMPSGHARLDVGSLPPRSSSPTVAGCRLGGFSVGRDWWGGERIVGGVPRINFGTGGGACRVGETVFFMLFWSFQ